MPRVRPPRPPDHQSRVRGISLIRPRLLFGTLDAEALRGMCPTPAFDAVRVQLRGCTDFTTDAAHLLASWASAGWQLQLEGPGPALPDLVRTVERMTRQLLDVEAQFVEAG